MVGRVGGAAGRGTTAPRIFDEDYDARSTVAVTRRIMLIGRRYRRLLDQALRQMGHSQLHWEIMHAISLDEGECTLMEVASRIGLEGPSIVAAMKKLDADGFIERRQDGKDRRSRIIRLTAKGKGAVRAMARVVDRQRASLWDGIGDAEINQMLRILGRMRANLWDEPEADG